METEHTSPAEHLDPAEEAAAPVKAPWHAPTMREVEYSSTESGPVGSGADAGIYS